MSAENVEVVRRTVAALERAFDGHDECVPVWSDFLRWADDHRVKLEEVDDLGGDRTTRDEALEAARVS